jgi:hypothetical protein
LALPSDDRCKGTLRDLGNSSSNLPLLNSSSSRKLHLLAFRSSGRRRRDHPRLQLPDRRNTVRKRPCCHILYPVSLSLSLSCGQIVSSGGNQRQIAIRVRVILPRLLSSRSVSTREPGRYKLELLSLLLTTNLFTLPFSSTTQLLLSTSSSTIKVGILRCLFFS